MIYESDIPRLAKETAGVYRRWATLIHEYHGGMPEALLAVRALIESNGTMDMKMGSDTAIGVLSVTAAQEKRFGVPNKTRFTEWGNVFLAAVRNNADTALFLQKYPKLPASFYDCYVYGGQLISMIGTGAAGYLFKHAVASGLQGISYEKFTRWVAAEANVGRLPTKGPWGNQTLATIVYRVRALWIMTEAARLSGAPNVATAPVIPKIPPQLTSFRVPKDVAAALAVDPASYKFGPPRWGKTVLIASAGGLVGLGALLAMRGARL